MVAMALGHSKRLFWNVLSRLEDVIWQVNSTQMEAARSSRSSSTERDETEYDAKIRDIELLDTATASALQSSATGESSAPHQATSCPQENLELKSDPATGHGDDDMAMKLRRKIYEGGLGDVRVPELRMSGCSECEEIIESDDDEGLCSSSSDDGEESSYMSLASGVMPPVLPVRLDYTFSFPTLSPHVALQRLLWHLWHLLLAYRILNILVRC